MILDIPQEIRMTTGTNLRVSVLLVSSGRNYAPQLTCHGLHPITDSENRNPQREYLVWCFGSVCAMHAFRSPGKNDTPRPEFGHRFSGDVPREQLRVDAGFANAAGNQLTVLGTEIEDQDALVMRIRPCRCDRRCQIQLPR